MERFIPVESNTFRGITFSRFYRHFTFRKRFQVQYHLLESAPRVGIPDEKLKTMLTGSTTPSLFNSQAVFAQLFSIRFPRYLGPYKAANVCK